MFIFYLYLGIALGFGPSAAHAQESDPPVFTTESVQISLYSESGRAAQTFLLNYEDPNTDVLFKYQVPKEHENYASWAFEVTCPADKLAYQMAFESKLPKIIHWDGYFDAKNSIQANKKYFVRLLLVKEDNKIYASQWKEFAVVPLKEKPAPLDPSLDSNFYVTPSVNILMMSAKTTTQQSLYTMDYVSSLRFILFNRHTLEGKFEASSPVVFDFGGGGDHLQYSSLSFYYRFRILGSASRSPRFTFIPEYIPRQRPNKTYGGEFYGSPVNLELGVGYFHNLIKATAGSALDSELAHQFDGVSGVLKIDEQLGRFRLFQGFEYGQSLVTGAVSMIMGEFGVAYDYFENLEPGLYARYLSITGTSPTDSALPGQPISNTLLSFGVMMHLKI